MEQKYLSRIYELAYIFLLPTEHEIFGMILLEAMYYLTVVLTTDNGGFSTLIENEKNGCIIDELDDSVWADKILSIIENKSQVDVMRDNAHNTIANMYTWNHLADLFISSYQSVGDRR